jgi:hypothetical protein
MALEVPVRLIRRLPDAVQVRLAADARRPAAFLRQRRLHENGKG